MSDVTIPYPTLNGQTKHPFTCQVAGPSRSGKSTFVRNLLLHQNCVIDVEFDYIIIVMGTEASANPILASLQSDLPISVTVMDINAMYSSRAEMVRSLSDDMKTILDKESQAGRKGCIVFDDLMNELSESDLLLDLFTKISSHYNISTIYITQNVFFKGKRSGDSSTLYRNTHLLVLFKNPLDNSVTSIISKRLVPAGKISTLNTLLNTVLTKYRYVAIYGDMNTDTQLQFRTELFNNDPVQHQRVFQLDTR